MMRGSAAAALISPKLGLLSITVLVVGFVDMAGDFPRFRRQYVPAAVLAAVTIPMYCAPVVLYLVCYQIGCWLKGWTDPNSPQLTIPTNLSDRGS